MRKKITITLNGSGKTMIVFSLHTVTLDVGFLGKFTPLKCPVDGEYL